MNIGIIGTGYVGTTTAACFADIGHDVWCYDINQEKINTIKSGKSGIFEPGLDDLIVKNRTRIHCLDNIIELNQCDLIFVCVGTPSAEDGSLDTTYVRDCISMLCNVLDQDVLIVIKSTVPVGTCKSIFEDVRIKQKKENIDIASNPEFLREGSAVNDFNEPDRIVVGINNEIAKSKMIECYKKLIDRGINVVFTDITSSEIIKCFSNAFLAMKISFINEVAIYCNDVGANIVDVATGIGMDNRIGRSFLRPGPGYGGSCFPKDVSYVHFVATSPILNAIKDSNKSRIDYCRNIILETCKEHNAKVIACLGLSFKANTDDVRDSISEIIVNDLYKNKFHIKLFDPKAMENFKKVFHFPEGDVLEYCKSAQSAVNGADCVVILTEWEEFKAIETRSTIIDTRRIVELSDKIPNIIYV